MPRYEVEVWTDYGRYGSWMYEASFKTLEEAIEWAEAYNMGKWRIIQEIKRA